MSYYVSYVDYEYYNGTKDFDSDYKIINKSPNSANSERLNYIMCLDDHGIKVRVTVGNIKEATKLFNDNDRFPSRTIVDCFHRAEMWSNLYDTKYYTKPKFFSNGNILLTFKPDKINGEYTDTEKAWRSSTTTKAIIGTSDTETDTDTATIL